MTRNGGELTAIFLAIVAVFALAKCGNEARAHDIYHDWKIPGTTTSCCNDKDCRPTSAWQDMEGRWLIRVNGQDIVIPDRVILPEQPDGRCHVCEMHGTVFCFAPCRVRS